jgi:uncharacterized protein
MGDFRGVTNQGVHQGSNQVAVAAVLGAAMVASAVILAGAVVRVKTSRELIRVTGSAQRSIESDFIIWRAAISDHATTPQQAYAQLQHDRSVFTDYLIERHVPASEIFPQSIESNAMRGHETGMQADDPRQPVIGYLLTQAIEVRSGRVALVDQVARESTDLIVRGLSISSEPPQYIYTRMGNLKLEMLAAASRDARERAERIAVNAGSRLGPLKYARMGVLQIEGRYDSEGVEDSGANDTSSRDKKVTAVVTASFTIR